jgi:hypothetical protein
MDGLDTHVQIYNSIIRKVSYSVYNSVCRSVNNSVDYSVWRLLTNSVSELVNKTIEEYEWN